MNTAAMTLRTYTWALEGVGVVQDTVYLGDTLNEDRRVKGFPDCVDQSLSGSTGPFCREYPIRHDARVAERCMT